MLGYTGQEVERMVEVLYYSKQDAENAGDEVSVEWLQKTIDLLDGLLVEGHIESAGEGEVYCGDCLTTDCAHLDTYKKERAGK